jgi:hypothetical protein
MRQLYKKYHGYLPASFFIGGFIFDLLTTDRIDQSFSLIQQALYLFLIMILLYWEVITPTIFLKEDSFLNKVWTFHVEVLHFLFGSLLSLYAIFYFKSSSLITSFVFMAFLASILIINELPRFQKSGIVVRSSLFALCLSSYFIYLIPVLTGKIGFFPFIFSMTLSMCLFLFLCTRIHIRKADKKWLHQKVLLPGIVIQTLFVVLYVTKLLPPVPISLKYIGIYQDINKQNGDFYLNYERPWWKIWQSGAQTFVKREGDKIYCFVSIFSPTQFKDNVQLVWYLKNKQGEWSRVDQVTLPILGGRDQGYRGYASKANFELGKWQVRVITSDLREVGRVSFEVVDAELGSQRKWLQDKY